MVSDYGDGCDFYGPKECDCCCGNGCYWITPRGRHVLYPGRPVLLISAPVDHAAGASVAASKAEATRNSMDNAVKFSTIGIGAIAHGLGNSVKIAPTIARIERRRRGAQRVEIFIRQLEHD